MSSRNTNKKHKPMKDFLTSLEINLDNNGAEGDEGRDAGLTMTKKQRKEPEVVVYENPSQRKKRKMNSAVMESAIAEDNGTTLMSVKQLNHEVQQLGVSAFSPNYQVHLERQRAIKLGAKPSRKAHVNYKKYQETVKRRNDMARKQNDLNRTMGLKAVSLKKTPERKKFGHGFWVDRSRGVDGQIGRFNDGVLKISEKDLKQIKSTKVKKKS